MSDSPLEKARSEVYYSMRFCNFCTQNIGIYLTKDDPKTYMGKFKNMSKFGVAALTLFGLVLGECFYVGSLLVYSTSVAEFVASLHIVGYGILSVFKMLMLWLKRPVFKQVVNELVELWPMDVRHEEAEIKRGTLSALRLGQLAYMFWNVIGDVLYSISPIVIFLYHRSQGVPSELGYIWKAVYPFDKTEPVNHVLVYIYEAVAGYYSVMSMLSSDIIFTTMASHISMLLRVLQVKIRSLGATNSVTNFGSDENRLNQTPRNTDNGGFVDCYDEIVSVIKIHQRLISYSIDLEEVFSMVNLLNVLLSSVNICCVVFNIVLLEPWMEVSNKFFLGAALTQVGIICWYADDIFRASMGVADAVYESRWYNSNTRCRRALLLLLGRSQKPLCFTALKFRNITMSTYSSILTTSYSYFALLYTMYSDK